MADIWMGLEEFDPIEKSIASEIVIASMTITDTYLGPNRKNGFTLQKITDKQAKSLQYMDYYEIVEGLIKLFMTLLLIRNDILTPYCKSIFKKLFREHLVITDELDTVDKDRIQAIVFNGLNSFNCSI